MTVLKSHHLNIRVLISLFIGAGLVWLVSVLWLQDIPTRIFHVHTLGKQVNVSKSVRINVLYVSQCGGNFDNRRLGNQLFNFAAMMYAAHGLNKNNSGYKHLGRFKDIMEDFNVSAADGVKGVKVNGSEQLQAYFYVPYMPLQHPHGWMDRWFDLDIARPNTSKNICPSSGSCVQIGESFALAFCPNIDKELKKYQSYNRNLLVCGWYQSWRYTVGVEAELRRQLRFQKYISNLVDAFFEQTKPCRWSPALCGPLSNFTRVGIHVRRADILKPDKVSFGYTVPDRHYLKRAMEYFACNTTQLIQFVVVSDDVGWTKDAIAQNGIIGMNNTSVVFSNESNLAAVDLAILSRCDGMIMTTGTFGWWGAWLANKKTIYYSHWPAPGSPLSGKFIAKDFFPSEWIPMK